MVKEVFEEKQRFNQWWIWIGIVTVFIIFAYQFIEKEGGAELITPFSVLGLVVLLMGSTNLQTRIDEQGIHIKMFPFHFSEVHYLWEDIYSVQVVTYSPLFDYGGWGIRGLGNNRAFNVRGSIGIKIQTVSGKTRMIGTQQEDLASVAIQNYFSKKS